MTQEDIMIHAESKQTGANSTQTFKMGAHVMAYDEREKEWKAGQVVGINKLGRYDVSFETGREAVNLKAIQLKARDVESSLRSTGSNEISTSRTSGTINDQTVKPGTYLNITFLSSHSQI